MIVLTGSIHISRAEREKKFLDIPFILMCFVFIIIQNTWNAYIFSSLTLSTKARNAQTFFSLSDRCAAPCRPWTSVSILKPLFLYFRRIRKFAQWKKRWSCWENQRDCSRSTSLTTNNCVRAVGRSSSSRDFGTWSTPYSRVSMTGRRRCGVTSTSIPWRWSVSALSRRFGVWTKRWERGMLSQALIQR